MNATTSIAHRPHVRQTRRAPHAGIRFERVTTARQVRGAAALQGRVYSEFYPYKQLFADVDSYLAGNHVSYVAESADRTLSHGALVPHHTVDDVYEIGRLMTDPNTQGLGLGSQMIGHLLQSAHQLGARVVYAECGTAHSGSIKAFYRHGFAPHALVLGRWLGGIYDGSFDLEGNLQRETGLVMVKQLDTSKKSQPLANNITVKTDTVSKYASVLISDLNQVKWNELQAQLFSLMEQGFVCIQIDFPDNVPERFAFITQLQSLGFFISGGFAGLVNDQNFITFQWLNHNVVQSFDPQNLNIPNEIAGSLQAQTLQALAQVERNT